VGGLDLGDGRGRGSPQRRLHSGVARNQGDTGEGLEEGLSVSTWGQGGEGRRWKARRGDGWTVGPPELAR
jgi:hypothetical protein